MRRGPLLTLLVVVLFAVVVLSLNLANAGRSDRGSPAEAVQPAPRARPAPVPAAAATPFPAEVKYIGHTEEHHVAIAVTVRNGQVSAYLCDGKAIEGWYQGSAADGKIDATGRGANTLTGSLSGSTLSGTVSAGGRSWSYSAEPVTAPAGLYRAKTSAGTVGWIRDSNGQVTGLANQGGTVQPAPVLDPGTAAQVNGGDQVVAR